MARPKGWPGILRPSLGEVAEGFTEAPAWCERLARRGCAVESELTAYGEKVFPGILAPDLSGSDSFMAPPRVSPQRWPFNFLASFNA